MLNVRTIPVLMIDGIQTIAVKQGSELIGVYTNDERFYVLALEDRSVTEDEDRKILIISVYGWGQSNLPHEAEAVRLIGQQTVRNHCYLAFETLPEDIADPDLDETESGEIEKEDETGGKSKAHKKQK